MRQTAVEFLEFRYKNNINLIDYDFEEAKEMEKQQIIDANNRGYSVGRKDIYETAEEYYNQTFKNEK